MPHRGLKALRRLCGDLKQPQFAVLIGLRNFRSLTNIESGWDPLTWKLACKIQEVTGVSAASLMENSETLFARYGQTPFTHATFVAARSNEALAIVRSREDQQIWDKALAADIGNATKVLETVLRAADAQHKFSAALSTFDFWVGETVAEHDLMKELEKRSRSGDSTAAQVIKATSYLRPDSGAHTTKPKQRAR